MNRIGTLALVLLAVVACIAGLYVSAANRDIVVIDLLFWPSVGIRSGLLVVLAFVAGAVIGMLVTGLAASARLRRQQWRAIRQGRAG